ncbi:hypothetical protein MLD38_020593, partial [Melastoma candidum]
CEISLPERLGSSRSAPRHNPTPRPKGLCATPFFVYVIFDSSWRDRQTQLVGASPLDKVQWRMVMKKVQIALEKTSNGRMFQQPEVKRIEARGLSVVFSELAVQAKATRLQQESPCRRDGGTWKTMSGIILDREYFAVTVDDDNREEQPKEPKLEV